LAISSELLYRGGETAFCFAREIVAISAEKSKINPVCRNYRFSTPASALRFSVFAASPNYRILTPGFFQNSDNGILNSESCFCGVENG
jgi:hypothetical protein